MREGVFPRWEDINNMEGGYWSFRLLKSKSDQIWKEFMACVIGNTLVKNDEDMKYINGISLSPKINNCIIKVWNNDYNINDVNILNNNIKDINLTEGYYKRHDEQSDFQK